MSVIGTFRTSALWPMSALRQELPLHERSFRKSACANTFLVILRGAVRTLSHGLRCPCQSRAEDQATATPVWLWLAEPTFSLCADEGYERSCAIAGDCRQASKT